MKSASTGEKKTFKKKTTTEKQIWSESDHQHLHQHEICGNCEMTFPSRFPRWTHVSPLETPLFPSTESTKELWFKHEASSVGLWTLAPAIKTTKGLTCNPKTFHFKNCRSRIFQGFKRMLKSNKKRRKTTMKVRYSNSRWHGRQEFSQNLLLFESIDGTEFGQ